MNGLPWKNQLEDRLWNFPLKNSESDYNLFYNMRILWLNIYKWKYQDFLTLIEHPEKPTLVFTPNPEILVRAHADTDFYLNLKKADYLTPDANGLYTASLIQEGVWYYSALFRTLLEKKQLEETYGELIRGSSLTFDLVDFAMKTGETVLMIDNYRIKNPTNPFEIRKKEIQSRLPVLFREVFPELKVEIMFDNEKSPEEIARIIVEKDIRYVFSCIGMKYQEERLVEIFAYLPLTTKVVWLGVGSSFDYFLWLQKRAPLFLQKLGLEWLYRLLQDPIGRWSRIKTALIDFPRLIESQK